MRVPLIMIISILLLVSCSFSNARTTPAEEYWKIVMKDVPMPQAVKDFVDSDSSSYDSMKDVVDPSFDNKKSYFHPTIPRWLDQYIEYKIASYLAQAPAYVKNYFLEDFDKKSAWEYYHSKNPGWLNSQDSVSSNKKSFFTRDFDKKHAWEWYYG